MPVDRPSPKPRRSSSAGRSASPSLNNTPPSATAPSASRTPGFYAGALDDADRLALAAAGAVTGLDQEIALLRLRIRRLLQDHPDDYPLAVRAIELLVRAVGAAGRLGNGDADGLLDRIGADLDGILRLLADAQSAAE